MTSTGTCSYYILNTTNTIWSVNVNENESESENANAKKTLCESGWNALNSSLTLTGAYDHIPHVDNWVNVSLVAAYLHLGEWEIWSGSGCVSDLDGRYPVQEDLFDHMVFRGRSRVLEDIPLLSSDMWESVNVSGSERV